MTAPISLLSSPASTWKAYNFKVAQFLEHPGNHIAAKSFPHNSQALAEECIANSPIDF